VRLAVISRFPSFRPIVALLVTGGLATASPPLKGPLNSGLPHPTTPALSSPGSLRFRSLVPTPSHLAHGECSRDLPRTATHDLMTASAATNRGG
jgi:hypothetical protein